MNYVLVKKSELLEKGVTNFGAELSDGRVVMTASATKTIDGLTDAEVMSLEQVKELIEADKKASIVSNN